MGLHLHTCTLVRWRLLHSSDMHLVAYSRRDLLQ